MDKIQLTPFVTISVIKTIQIIRWTRVQQAWESADADVCWNYTRVQHTKWRMRYAARKQTYSTRTPLSRYHYEFLCS